MILICNCKGILILSNIAITDDNQSEADEDDENRESNGIDEAIEAPDPTKKQSELEPLKKKIIRNPMPKLNPDRILGPRGVTILSEVFQDFTPKGGDHVFEDLDRAMKKMEHWAHRMYPKLPFDDTMARVSVLGKKMQIQVSYLPNMQGLKFVVDSLLILLYRFQPE